MSLELDKTVHAGMAEEETDGASYLAAGSLFASRYVIEAFLGCGGMGTVYRARDQKLDDVIALKTLTLKSEVAVERFYREVRLARRVTHPNVVRTHDLGDHEGVHFLTMELVRGMPLDEVLQQRGALTPERVRVLSRTRGLRVLALGATRRYADARDPQQISAELACDSVIDGTVQMAGSARVRLAARLYERDGVQHWSDRFDGDFADLFELQESMGRRVAEALRLELSAAAYRYHAPPEALALYLRARRYLRRELMTEAERAVEMLDEALRLAPSFHPAIAAHAIACIRAWWASTSGGHAERARRAQESCQRAFEEVPELAETHLARGMFAAQSGRYDEAVEALAHALEIAPTMADAQHYLGELQLEAGRTKEGRQRLELALQLDPTLGAAFLGLARSALLHGEEQDYLRHVESLRQAFPDPPLGVLVTQLRWNLMRAEIDEARVHLRTLHTMETAAGQYSYALARLAFGEGTLEELRAVEAVSAGRIDNRRFTSLMGQITAEVMAVAGEHEAALDVLERIAGGVLIDVVWLRRYPHFAPLRDRPRFRAALDEVAARARSMWQRS